MVWWAFSYHYLLLSLGVKKIGERLTKLQAKRLIALYALFTLQWSWLKMKNWPDNLFMTNRNCFCFCYVTTLIIFDFGVNKYQTKKYFSTNFLSGWVLHHSLLHSVIDHGNVWIRIFCKVVEVFMCGGKFNNEFIANLLMSLPVKEFWHLAKLRTKV